jgi:hypothetical protein
MKLIARQPILPRERSVYAYDLLFRSGIQNSCEGIHLEPAAASRFDTSFLIGLDNLTGDSAHVSIARETSFCGIIFRCFPAIWCSNFSKPLRPTWMSSMPAADCKK